MSLILEALRKREREKQVPERGFLVMAETAWAPARGRGGWAIVMVAALAFGLGVGFVSLRQLPRPPSATTPLEARPVAAARVPASAVPAITLLPAPTPPAVSPVTAEPASPATPAPVAATTPLPAATLAPAATPSPAAIGLVLQAISQRDGQPVALISDHLLREGDTLDGARILHIGEAEVELELDGRRLTLHF